MGVDALKGLIAGDVTQQPVKQDEPVGGVGGAVSDQAVEKKQEDYDKGVSSHLEKFTPSDFCYRIRRDVAIEETKATEEETGGSGQCRTSIGGKNHVS